MNHSRRVHGGFTLPLYRKLRLALPFCLLLLIVGAQQSIAQNESGVRFLLPSAFSNSGYDSTTDWYHRKFPILRSLPPLNSGMPPEVMAAYIHLDSLARFNTNGDLVQPDKATAAWRARPELLKKTLAACYTAMDYDPLMFEQYDMETALKRGRIYKIPLGFITGYFPGILTKAASIPREGGGLRAAFAPDYVLRVKVVTIDSMLTNYSTPLPGGIYIFSVTAQILDTLKGRAIPFCEPNPVGNGSNAMPLSTNMPPTIRFQYFHNNYVSYSSRWDKMPEQDSAFIAMNEGGWRDFTMHVGQEAVVFLDHSAWKLDTMYDYYDLAMSAEAYYALPIINGQVRDVNHYWSDNLLMNYADWRRRFLEIREKILSGTY